MEVCGMDIRNETVKGVGVLRRIIALVLVLCFTAGLMPAALGADNVGTSSASLTRSAKKYFVQVPAAGAVFFTGDTYGSGSQVTVPAGTVCQLVTDNYYTATGSDAITSNYYSLYYNNTQYQVRCTDVVMLSDDQLQSYIENSIWRAGTHATLKQTLNLVGDVRVYALQLALSKLGYYSISLDGDYGKKTDDAVYKFQQANGLSRDGDAGPITQAALYALVTGTSAPTTPSTGMTGSTGTVTTPSGTVSSTTGTLRTRVSVNLREKASQKSGKIGVVPINVNLTYFDTSTNDNVTWYKVVYGDQTGWLMGTYVNATAAGSSSGAGALTTTDSVNLRKYASKSSARLGSVPKGVSLAFSDTATSGGVTWYKVVYGNNTGWIMGTYTSLGNTGSSGSTIVDTNTVTGSVTITKPGTVVRLTPGGKRSGTLLAKGSIVDMIGSPVTSGSYTWYGVKLVSGLTGYVRGDCASASTGVIGGTGSGSTGGTIGGVSPTSTKRFIRLPVNTTLFASVGTNSGAVTAPAGTVVQMVDGTTFVGSDGVVYCRVYYQSKAYNAVYSNISAGLLDDAALAAYVLNLWNSPLNAKFYDDDTLVGDVRVYAMQVALYVLGYYTGELDGTYGSGSEAAVKNFQRKQSGIDRDGVMGDQTWPLLTAQAKQVSNGSTTYVPGLGGTTGGSGSTGSGSTGSGSTGIVDKDFGTVYRVQKANWNFDDNGAALFPKSTTAQVMDVETGKVFTIYRWSGGNHADCVPMTAADTRIMCEIVGARYQSQSPSSSQLDLIKGDIKNDNANYCWPDFNGNMGGTNIGSAWDRRAAWLNVNGTVYCVSIYGYPHGWMDTRNGSLVESSFTKEHYEKNNNYYGMMCIHFSGSKTHSGSGVDSAHNDAINKAYNEAKKRWGTLVQ